MNLPPDAGDRSANALVAASRRSIRWLVTAALTIAAGGPVTALAAGLGPIVEQSSLGQPLRVVIPLLLGPGEEVTGECFRLVAAEREQDGIPQALFGRVALERTGDTARIVVTHQRPVNEPVLRLTVGTGCNAAVRREYTLLMDPPVIDVPTTLAEAEPVRAPAVVAPVARERGRATAGAATGAGRAASRPGTGAAPKTRKTSPAKGSGAKEPPVRRPPPAVAEGPRLKVSRAAPGGAPEAAAKEAPTAQQVQAQQDLANALEAETVVLRQRVAELSALVDRMQEQVRAQEAQQRAADEAAKRAADEARTPAPPPAAGWWEANWPLVALIVGAPLLIAGGLLWRRRSAVVQPPPWQMHGVPADHFESTTMVTELPPVPAAGARAPAPKSTRAGTTGTRPSALAVSELSQITEEARVYIALGHPDRAMNVLREHIRQVPRTIPAAWLMLLDLYHAHGRRQEFRQLAQEFHQRCNVETPTWESYTTREHDPAGLSRYPHVTKRIVGLWRLPECRDYLEGLLLDNREGQRGGFSLAAYADILMLLQVLDAPAVDVDSDLAEEGKLRAAWNAAAREAKLFDLPGPAETSGPPAASARPSAPRPVQEPIVFELDTDIKVPEPRRRPQ